MSAILDGRDSETEPCPLSEGDEFRVDDLRIEIVDIRESGGRWFVLVETEHPRQGVARYERLLSDVRARVRDGRWSR